MWLRTASWMSAAFDPKLRKMVTSLTPASSAMRRVVAPRKPHSAYTRAAASMSFDRLIMRGGKLERPEAGCK